jgi:CRP/FNR family cyclic AMP-dependent transcriptional regulator
MISPEIFRRYPFFTGLNDTQLKALSTLTKEVIYEKGATIFEECDQADRMFLLVEGGVDLSYRSQEEFHPTNVKEFSVGEINPGEVFGTSSIIEPYELNATARTSNLSRLLVIDSLELRKLMDKDLDLTNKLYLQVIKTLKERMIDLRVQLAAAR